METNVWRLTIETWLCRLTVVAVSSEMFRTNTNSVLTASKWTATLTIRFLFFTLISIPNVAMFAFAVSVWTQGMNVTFFTFINLAVGSTKLRGA